MAAHPPSAALCSARAAPSPLLCVWGAPSQAFPALPCLSSAESRQPEWQVTVAQLPEAARPVAWLPGPTRLSSGRAAPEPLPTLPLWLPSCERFSRLWVAGCPLST